MRLAVATPGRPLQSAPPDELADIVRDEAFVVVEVDELDQVVRDVLGLEALHLADHDLAGGPTYDSAYRSGTLEAVVPVADAAGCHPLYVAATAKALVARQPVGDVDLEEYCERVRWDAHRPGAVAIYLLLETCLRSFRSAIREVRTTLEDIEDAMIESVDRHHVITLHDLHRRVSGMRRALSEYGDAITDMNEDLPAPTTRHRREVLDLADAHAGAVAAVQNRLAVVRDEAANAMQLYRSLVTTVARPGDQPPHRRLGRVAAVDRDHRVLRHELCLDDGPHRHRSHLLAPRDGATDRDRALARSCSCGGAGGCWCCRPSLQTTIRPGA